MFIYLALALVAVVLIAAVAFRMRSRSSRQSGSPPGQKPADTASITLKDPPARPQPAAGTQQFDEDKTMVYLRPNQTPGPAAPREREEAPSLTLSGVHLVGLTGNQKGQRFPVATTGITIGRSSSCDIVLTDSCVSSRHAWIGLVDGKVTLRDLKSRNGTFLNAQLRSSISEVQLRAGDTIFIGGHLGEQFRFEAD
jgi:hypothetical protein